MSKLTDLYGESQSLHLKAADNVGFNKQVKILSASEDEVTFPGEKPKRGIVIEVGAIKPIWLSRTNASVLLTHFGEDLGTWVGRQIILQTKNYEIKGALTTGWITIPVPDESATQGDLFSDDLPMT